MFCRNHFQFQLKKLVPLFSSTRRVYTILISPHTSFTLRRRATNFLTRKFDVLNLATTKEVVLVASASKYGVDKHRIRTSRTFSSDGPSDGTPKIVVFYGSTRTGRYADRVGVFVQKIVQSNGMEPIVFDPLKMPFEMLKMPLHFHPDPSKAPSWLRDANKVIQEADGYLLICTEYNSSPPPALTNMLNHFPKASFLHKPAGIVHYAMGAFGGSRAATILKPFMSDIGMIIIPSYVAIPGVDSVFDNSSSKCNNTLVCENVKKLVKELHWYVKGLRKHRKAEPFPE